LSRLKFIKSRIDILSKDTKIKRLVNKSHYAPVP
jgi:hypothetical protein